VRAARLIMAVLLAAPLFAAGTAKPPVAPPDSLSKRAEAKPAIQKPPTAAPASKPAAAQTSTAAAASAPAAPKASQVPAKPAPPPKVTDGQRDFCNLVWGCGLPMPQGYCPDPKYVPKPDFKFDSTRCSEARLLTSRGVTPAHPLYGYNLYRFLGMEYRTLYTIEDELPISQERLAYLLADLPLSAHLVSYFQDEPYTAEYIDAERRHFKGTKGKRLRGDAALISGSSDEKHLFYFGYGIATVAWWTLKGPALMDFSYYPDPSRPKALKYRMKLLVFPGNGVINGIMNLGLFRKVVLSKVKEVLNDITATAKKLAEPGAAGKIQGAKDWSPEEKKKIEEFLKLP
jgi:hypothetical protein